MNRPSTANKLEASPADIPELLKLAKGQWPRILVGLGIPAEKLAPWNRACPRCAEPQFLLSNDFPESGAVCCEKCFHAYTHPQPGNGLATICWWLNVDQANACRVLAARVVRRDPSETGGTVEGGEAAPAMPATSTADAIDGDCVWLDAGRLSRTESSAEESWHEPWGEPWGEPWDEPIAVDLPELPVEVLPEPLREYTIALANATQTPPDMAGLISLAVCAGAVGSRVQVNCGGEWFEPLNFWAMVLLEPANRKSEVLRQAVAPLREIERELISESQSQIAIAESSHRVMQRELALAEKLAATGDEGAKQRAENLATELATWVAPVEPKLVIDDSSSEKLEVDLAAQGGQLFACGAEAGIFQSMLRNPQKLDCFLKGHAGEGLQTERVTRKAVKVERACLTMAYAIQPEFLRQILCKQVFRSRGLIGRFLYAMPRSPLGYRQVGPEPVPEAVKTAYNQAVRKLAAITSNSDKSPKSLSMTPEALERFRGWQMEIEAMLRDGGRLAAMKDWGGKLAGVTARLAGVMHLVSRADDVDPTASQIGVETIEAAIRLARWAIPHAEAAIGLISAESAELEDAAYILRWLRELGSREVSRRDVLNHGRARFNRDPDRLDRALWVLVDRGWLRLIGGRRPGPGRPSVRYQVYPSIASQGACRPTPAPQRSATPIFGSSFEELLSDSGRVTREPTGSIC